MLQSKESPQQLFLGRCKHLHVRRALPATQDRGQRDDDDVQQIVQRVRCTRIGQRTEDIADIAHRAPSANREPSSESISPARATPARKSTCDSPALQGRVKRQCVTRQIVPPVSSEISSDPSLATAIPTGRPHTWVSFTTNPVTKSSY